MTHTLGVHYAHAACSQSEFRVLKIRDNSTRALLLYNCSPNTQRVGHGTLMVHSRARRIDALILWVILLIFFFFGNIEKSFQT